MKYDVVIVGSGPAGLGAAFKLITEYPSLKILIIEKDSISSGGLRNDCKQNYTFPIGFPLNSWERDQAERLLKEVSSYLSPSFLPKHHFNIYQERANKLNVQMVDIQQFHVGTDGAVVLINSLVEQLKSFGVTFRFNTKMIDLIPDEKIVMLFASEPVHYEKLIIAPGRKGFQFLKDILEKFQIEYTDNIVDIGIRIEAKQENYPIVKDYYDPKFLFPDKVRTFCTNSGAAFVTKEKYENFYSANGHSLSENNPGNGLVNFAILKTIHLTDPITSGQQFAQIMGNAAQLIAGDNLLMQRVGDFRMGRRSKKDTFHYDLYDFSPTLEVTAGDISLAMPSKILRDIWRALKMLDTIIPGILHPSTIMYYPEIKMYANNPSFSDQFFQTIPNVYMIGDGAGTSRGITAAWASGIRASEGIITSFFNQ